MAKEKMWAGRTAGAVSRLADDFNSSIHIDSVMYRQDIKGSMCHAAMLAEQGIISSADADEATRAEAQAKISAIATDIQNEANIETLVKAKGFEECVAVIGDGTVSVIVKAESLQAKETAQILSIVYETTGIAPENVSIINK